MLGSAPAARGAAAGRGRAGARRRPTHFVLRPVATAPTHPYCATAPLSAACAPHPARLARAAPDRYDFIHYTGSTVVGKIVNAAAAKYLTPVLLELGGKSPAIVSKKADMKRACQRIAWGKWTMNNGQTCISPDYVITTLDAVDEVIQGLKDAVAGFYGENHKECRDISRMISARHLQRVAVQLDDESITVELGGEVDEGNLYIAPTIVRAEKTSKIMEDEIFGPVLPVIVVDDLDAAIEHVNIGEKPLALYVFSEDQKELDNVIQSTSSGGACANDIVMHAGNPELPFVSPFPRSSPSLVFPSPPCLNEQPRKGWLGERGERRGGWGLRRVHLANH